MTLCVAKVATVSASKRSVGMRRSVENDISGAADLREACD